MIFFFQVEDKRRMADSVATSVDLMGNLILKSFKIY